MAGALPDSTLTFYFLLHSRPDTSTSRSLMTLARIRVLSCAVFLTTSLAAAQTPAAKPKPLERVAQLRCGALWDGANDQLQRNVTITIRGERIEKIGAFEAAA